MKLHDGINVYLANHQLLYVKLHNLHWYVRGANFFALHAKFEELYDEVAETIDEVAERLLMIGGTPIASLQGALKVATLKELEDKTIGCLDSVQVVLKDVEHLIASCKEVVTLAEKEGDQVTVDMFLEHLAAYQKLAWLLKSHID